VFLEAHLDLYIAYNNKYDLFSYENFIKTDRPPPGKISKSRHYKLSKKLDPEFDTMDEIPS